MRFAASDYPQAGPIALAIIVMLGIALVFLVRSMSKHLRRVPPSFDRPPRSEEHHDSNDDNKSA